MSEKVIIYLIVAVAIVLIIFMLRRQLKSTRFKAGGIEAGLETHGPDREFGRVEPRTNPQSINITGNQMKGNRNKIGVERGGVNLEENRLKGSDNEITVGLDETNQK